MTARARHFPRTGLALALLLLLPQTGSALLNIDGTRNQVFVFGSASFGWDSNLFAENTGRGDYTFSAQTGVEIKRRAGIIGVNATGTLDYLGFGKYREQNAWNPSFSLELNKTTGRTTGALTVQAFRSSKADSAVNLRTQSWNFPLGLNLKYPINDNYYLSSQTNYLNRRYVDAAGLTNFTDISEGVDIFYTWTSKTDLFAGYRIRYSETALGTSTDHSFSLGATGGLFAKMNGTIRAFYQLRRLGYTGESFNQVGASASVNWNLSQKVNLAGQIARDFNTAATGVTVDSSSTSLNAYYIFTRRFQANAGVSYGRNRFVGRNQPARQDDFFSWDLGASFTWNEHLKMGGSYTYLHNWSTLAFSDFERHGVTFDISSRF